MAIGPVQLLVLGFQEPNFRGEILAELDRLGKSDTVKVIDGLAVYKDKEGNVAAIKGSNLSSDEAVEFGATVGALIGLGAAGEEGLLAGAEIGAAGASDGVDFFSEEAAWDVIQDIPNEHGRRAHPRRAPLGDPVPQRRAARRGLPDLGRFHPRRGHRCDRRGQLAGRRRGHRGLDL